MQKQVDLYLQSLEARNSSANTVRGYRVDLKEFSEFVGQVEPNEVTRRQVRAFLVLILGKGLKRASVRRKLASIKSLFKWMADEDIITEDVAKSVDTPKVPQQIAHWYSEEEMAKILDGPMFGPFPERDRCILELFYATGVRVEELSGINLEDIQPPDVILIRGKGKKERQVIFGEIAQDALGVYLAARKRVLERKHCTSSSLFFGLTAGGAEIECLTVRHISRIVKQAAKAAGVPVRHPHSLRHSFCNPFTGTRCRNRGRIEASGPLQTIDHGALHAPFTGNDDEGLSRCVPKSQARMVSDRGEEGRCLITPVLRSNHTTVNLLTLSRDAQCDLGSKQCLQDTCCGSWTSWSQNHVFPRCQRLIL
jgi:integrase/recombinase XerC